MAIGTYIIGPGDTVGDAHLDLLDGVNYGITREELDTAGLVDATTEGVLKFDLHIYGATANIVARKRQALQQMLNAAKSWSKNPLAAQWITFQVKRYVDNVTFYDVTGGKIRRKRSYQTGKVATFTVELTVLPLQRRPAITLETTAELTNGSIVIEVPNVPGDSDALVRLDITDVSTTGVINQIRGARRAGDGIVASDFLPIIDLSANGGSSQTDTASVGGSFMQRSSLTGSWLDVALANGPSGQYHVGEFDIWARLKASSAALGQPGTFTVTKTDPVVTSVDTTETQDLWTAATPSHFCSDRAVASGSSQPSCAPTWPSSTPASGTLIAIAETYNGGPSSTGTGVVTPPSGWTLLNSTASSSEGAWADHVYIKQGAASESGSKTFTLDRANSSAGKPAIAVAMFAVANTDGLDILEFTRGIESGSIHEASGESTINPETVIVGVLAQNPNSSHTTSSLWFDEATERLDANDFNIASRVVTEEGAATRIKGILAAPNAVNAYMFGFRGKSVPGSVVVGTEVTTTTWGDLAAGSRQPTVYAVDAGGGISPGRTASSAIVTTVDGCKLTWGPSSNVTGAAYYISEWTFDGHTFRLYSQTRTFTLTSEQDAVLADDLPALAPNTKVGNYARLVYGQQTGDMDDGELVYVPDDNVFRWHQMAMATLPPVGALIDGDVANWRAGIQFLSGGSASPVGAADALWIVPHAEPQFVATYPSQNLATKRRWVMESTRRGTRMHGWLRDGDGVARGGIDIVGGMTLSPGDNLLALLCESASEVAGMGNHKVTVGITIWPRWTWWAAPDE